MKHEPMIIQTIVPIALATLIVILLIRFLASRRKSSNKLVGVKTECVHCGESIHITNRQSINGYTCPKCEQFNAGHQIVSSSNEDAQEATILVDQRKQQVKTDKNSSTRLLSRLHVLSVFSLVPIFTVYFFLMLSQSKRDPNLLVIRNVFELMFYPFVFPGVLIIIAVLSLLTNDGLGFSVIQTLLLVALNHFQDETSYYAIRCGLVALCLFLSILKLIVIDYRNDQMKLTQLQRDIIDNKEALRQQKRQQMFQKANGAMRDVIPSQEEVQERLESILHSDEAEDEMQNIVLAKPVFVYLPDRLKGVHVLPDSGTNTIQKHALRRSLTPTNILRREEILSEPTAIIESFSNSLRLTDTEVNTGMAMDLSLPELEDSLTLENPMHDLSFSTQRREMQEVPPTEDKPVEQSVSYPAKLWSMIKRMKSIWLTLIVFSISFVIAVFSASNAVPT